MQMAQYTSAALVVVVAVVLLVSQSILDGQYKELITMLGLLAIPSILNE